MGRVSGRCGHGLPWRGGEPKRAPRSCHYHRPSRPPSYNMPNQNIPSGRWWRWYKVAGAHACRNDLLHVARPLQTNAPSSRRSNGAKISIVFIVRSYVWYKIPALIDRPQINRARAYLSDWRSLREELSCLRCTLTPRRHAHSAWTVSKNKGGRNDVSVTCTCE